ncbi:MAG TPA: NAD(P)/FAD-dependent oxidoreductase [Acidimicrobiales bacterium]|nr:NAD(P)/FAD-dependent oxidoreductase [Acidimicrobiales bacterium]
MAATEGGRCVVVGGGFGGLQAVKALGKANVDVTLVDRHNYHLFQPLSYQVATGSLSPGEIAVPLRRIFRHDRRVRVLMAEVTGFDLQRREVQVTSTVAGAPDHRIPYDTLVVAGGSSYAYFGHDDWRSLALEVKSLDSALEVRGRILQAFEAAELETDPEARARSLTFVVVGAGPTGVEMAGQIAELANDTLPGEFRLSDPRTGKVLLVEMADRVLPGFAPSLSRRAARSLDRLGVTVLLDHAVVDVQPGRVEVKAGDGSVANHETRTVVWAAGVTASPLAQILGQATGAEVDRSGRVTVEPDLTLPGRPEVLALGDMVRVRDAGSGEARVLPGVAPVAMQQGRYAGRLIKDRLAGRDTPPFHYRDKGMLATIGRARAVADIRRIRLSGFVAWVTWLAVHIFYLIGFENRMIVLLRWAYSFFTRGRGARLITEAAGNAPPRTRVSSEIGGDASPPVSET